MTDSNGLARRVARMSEAFDRLSKGHGSGEDIALLDEYQRSGQWLKDYEADEAGLIPAGVNRSVLSQDGLYNLLQDLGHETIDTPARMTALVTGASRGIGLAIARELADVGYNLALVARSADALQTAKDELCNAHPGIRVATIAADLTQESSYSHIVAATVEEFGGVDLLVNCAGLAQQGSFTEVSPQQWDAIFAVNAKAPFFICKQALPYLEKSPKPIIINIASVVGFKGYIHQSVYASSKHALTGFTKVLAKEVQPLGIRVHLISPGGVATEMVKQMRPDIAPDELLQPEEIAEIVRFLVTKKGRGTIDQFYLRRFNSLAFD